MSPHLAPVPGLLAKGLVAALLWLLAGAALAGAEEPRALGGNPHGSLAIGCEKCHTPEGWRPLIRPLPFEHGKETGFPLVQSHKGVSCLGCHQDLRFAHVGTACADCHRDPHQGELGLGCESCHSPHRWDDRRRLADRHAATLFPLTGAHAAVDCAACHRGTPPFEFAATPTECFACHAEDYRRTTRPNHAQAGFPTQCQACHDTSQFEGADFRAHDSLFFPIFSGAHAGVWSSCNECHTNPGSFRVFSCLNCHAHRRSEMDDEHEDVRGYRYLSDACFSCHPRGRR